MHILPEVQILDGKVVTRSVSAGNHRIHDIAAEAAARKFESEGAQWLHVVDVDAARGHAPDNAEIVRRILADSTVPVQVAGGMRTLAQISDWFEAGAARVVLGTAAITDQALLIEASSRHPGGIVVNLATKDDWVMIDGWQTQTSFHPRDLVHDLQMAGIAGIIHTDIDRFEGDAAASLALTMDLSRELTIPVYTSGTVLTLDDLARLHYLPNIHGVIVGHALIVGTFTLAEALEVAAQHDPSLDPEVTTPVAEYGIHKATRAYLAAYNRSQGARRWNQALREAATTDNPYMEVLIPQEDLDLDPGELHPRDIQSRYEAEIDRADLLIVVLDGIENEAWTGFECGYARAKGKYLIGVRAHSPGEGEPPSRLTAMCDEVVYYDARDDWYASLSGIAQELTSRVLMHGQTEESA